MADKTALLALGGSVGDVEKTFNDAIKLLTERLGSLRAASRIYMTRPLIKPGVVDASRGDFRNMALAVLTTYSGQEIVAACLDIERALGRRRDLEERWGPRCIDIDLILLEDKVIDSGELRLPHPEMHLRDFVLRPLCEIAPLAVHPVLQKTVRDLLADWEESGEPSTIITQ